MNKNDEKRIEVIKYIMSGKSVAQTTLKFGYASRESVYRILRAFTPMVDDYAKNHTLNETLDNFKKYGLTEKWLNNNDIDCLKFNAEELLKKYRYGSSIDELIQLYNKSNEEIRQILTENRIPIREDEAKIVRGEGFITIEKNATDINYKSLFTGSIVFVKQAKYATDKNVMPSSIVRPALVVSPQWYLNTNKQTFTVIYGTTKLQKYENDCLKVNEYYTGKETYFPFNRIDTIRYTDLAQRIGEYEVLSEVDMNEFKRKFGEYFNINYVADFEVTDDEISKMILKLFNCGLNRNKINSVLNDTLYSCSKSLIQSTLDLNGYSGVKFINELNEEEVEEEDLAYAIHSDEEYELLEKELLAVKAERDVYKNLLEKSMNIV